MNLQEILFALQAGKIDSEGAKNLIGKIKINTRGTGHPLDERKKDVINDNNSIPDFLLQKSGVLIEQAGLNITLNSSPTKSGRITLQPLMDEPLCINSSEEQTKKLIPLSSPSSVLLQIRDNDEFKPEIDAEPTGGLQAIQGELIKSLGDALSLKYNDIDINQKFIDMGLDSIIGVEWIQEINKKYGTSLTVTKVYDYPSIREFASFIEGVLCKQSNYISPSLASGKEQELLERTEESIPLFESSEAESLTVPVILASEPSIIQKKFSSISLEVLQEELKVSLGEALAMKKNDIDVDGQYVDLGLDSIIGVEWIREVNKKYGTSIEAAKIYDYPSIRQFTEFLKEEIIKQEEEGGILSNEIPKNDEIKTTQSVQEVSSGSKEELLLQDSYKNVKMQTVHEVSLNNWSNFPELIPLNDKVQKKPVFWFHGGVGTVEGYRQIARKVQRPFYGIEPRGWASNRVPLYGIQAMAAYYVHIILSVQPEGPYDLGGYSLGGRIAYEVTRQLQELGKSISTIVMVDSIASSESPYSVEEKDVIQKVVLLQAINTVLLPIALRKKDKIFQILIHQDEVDLEADNEIFLQKLITIAKARGLEQTETQIYEDILRRVKVQAAYAPEKFSVLPLPNPQAIDCYYFRNKSGVFYGELEPYFRVTNNKITFDHTNYWEAWEKNILNFQVIDVDSSNHIMLLSETEACKTIRAFCEKLYSKQGISTRFLKAFIKKHTNA